MRVPVRALMRGFVAALGSTTAEHVVTGTALGIAGVALLQQTINTFGLDPALTQGLLLAVVLGVWGGTRNKTSEPHSGGRGEQSRRTSAIYLIAVVGLWPFWLSTVMDGIHTLPAIAWQWESLPWVLGVAAGVLSFAVPVGVAVRLLPERSQGSGVCLLAASTCAVVQACVLAPWWGVWIPAAAACAVLVATKLFRGRATLESAHAIPMATDRSQHPWHWILAIAVGLFTGEVEAVLSTLWPVTATIWHIYWAAVLGGIGCGLFIGRGRLLRASLLTGGLALFVLLVASRLPDFCLWMNSTCTSAALLESGRIATAFFCLFPLGYALAGCMTLTSSNHPNGDLTSHVVNRLALRDVTCFTFGAIAAQTAGAWGWNPLYGIAFAGLTATLAASGLVLQTASPLHRRSVAFTAALAAAILTGGVWSAAMWSPTRSARLLFSTQVVIAARTGWETILLPQFDDARPLARSAGRHGEWTLWQSRGGEVSLRENGIPLGTLTTRPEWSPQLAPEVLPVVWPLVLVDQPARVLVLGARSGAGLQAALVFPIREVVCQEPDVALVNMIRGPIAATCGHDPFRDERCRWTSQPEGWLPAGAEPFDVVVSQPATAALQSCSEEFTVEFYRRAAHRLSEYGVFCQRFANLDFGPQPLLTAAASLQAAFPETACLEVGAGEFLLLGAHRPEVLVRPDLPERLEIPHVATLLARCQWDWVMGLNIPAYDRSALFEAAHDVRVRGNSAAQGRLSFLSAHELLRWGPKLHETAAVLSKPRTATAAVADAEVLSLPDHKRPPGAKSRKSRYLDWLGSAGEQPAVLRRISEVVGQQLLVQRSPDTHWYEYRRELREELQEHPRTALQQVSQRENWHPEDRQRKAYFEALGAAVKQDRPTAAALQALEETLEPSDPLLTLFGHQEIAELYARGDVDPARELQHRLHVIYYAPVQDVSVRNVVSAIDCLVEHPQAVADDAERFDILNGLLQTLRARWEGRNRRPQKSMKVTLQEVERSLVSVEKAVQTMAPLAVTAGYTPDEWQSRATVLERLLLRPFRACRDELKYRSRESERKTRALLDRATDG